MGKKVIFGRTIILQKRELVDPKLLEIKAVINNPLLSKRQKIFIFGICCLALVAITTVLSLIPLYIKRTLIISVCEKNDCKYQSICIPNENNNNYTCKCLDGYFGYLCDDYNACWDDPCEGCVSNQLGSTSPYYCTCGSKVQDKECILDQISTSLVLVELKDGRLVSGYQNGTIIIWKEKIKSSFNTTNTIKIYAHEKEVKSLAVLKNNYLISGSCDNSIKIWEIGSDKTKLIDTIKSHSGCINKLITIDINESKFLVSASDDKTIKIWETKTFKILPKILTHKGAVLALAYSSSLNYLISGSQDKTIIVWNAKNLEFRIERVFEPGENFPYPLPFQISSHNNSITSLMFLKDDRTLISGSIDRTILFWNLDNLAPFKSIVLDKEVSKYESIKNIVYLNNNSVAITTSSYFVLDVSNFNISLIRSFDIEINSFILLNDKYATITFDNTDLDIYDYKDLPVYLYNLSEHTRSIQDIIALDKDYFVTCSGDSTLKLWNFATKQVELTYSGHKSYVYSILKLTENYFVSASRDRTIKLWERNSSSSQLTLYEHKGSVLSLELIFDGQFASGSCDNSIIIWTYENTTMKIRIKQTLKEHTDCVNTLSATRNTLLYSGSSDNIIIVWNCSGMCTVSRKLLGHKSAVIVLKTFNDRIISGSKDGKIIIWSFNRLIIEKLAAHNNAIRRLISIQNQTHSLIVTTGNDERLKFWNFDSKTKTVNLVQDISMPLFLDLIVFKNQIVGINNKTIYLIDTLTMAKSEIQSERIPQTLIKTKNSIITGNIDGSISVWNETLLNKVDYQIHNETILAMMYLNDGRFATATVDKKIIITDPKKFSLIKILDGHNDSVNCLVELSIDTSENRLASGSSDYKIIIWSIKSFEVIKILNANSKVLSLSTLLANNQLFLFSGVEGKIIVWFTNAYTIFATLKATNFVLSIVFFKPNFFASTGNNYGSLKDNSFKIWEYFDSFVNITTLEKHEAQVNAIEMLDSGYLLSGSKDSTIVVWDENYKYVETFREHTKSILSIKKISENKLATTSEDKSISIWDISKHPRSNRL